jgi:hypothetical protein
LDTSPTENQRKLEAVEQLAKVVDDASVSLIELAGRPRSGALRSRWTVA